MAKNKRTGSKDKAANINAAAKAGKVERGKALSDKELDQVGGGLNPQPLPPLLHPKY